MGKINVGILGAFIGKVGSVVGSVVNGKAVIRAIPQGSGSTPTKKQEEQHRLMAAANALLLPMLGFLKVGFARRANGMTEMNAATSYNLKNALQATDGDVAVDYSKVRVSLGNLPLLVHNVRAQVLADGTARSLEVAWENNSLAFGAADDDRVMLLVTNHDDFTCKYDMEAGLRSDGSLSATLPNGWAGTSFSAYMALRSADGRQVSESLHLGDFTL